MDAHFEKSSQALPVRVPTRLFATQKKMDDYSAADMQYGDLTQNCLESYYNLRDISKRINPFTHPNRGESARILFDEFRQLSDHFSFIGPYQGLMRRLIDHMQYGDGQKFSDPLLDQALAGHSSMESSLNAIKRTITNLTATNKKLSHQEITKNFENEIKASKLPKFNNWIDRVNGLTLSVHDIWAAHINLTSLEIYGSHYKAQLHFRIQDHFGLDDNDISNGLYRQFRIFRIWFILQRWENYGFKPFITEMNATINIEGNNFDKI